MAILSIVLISYYCARITISCREVNDLVVQNNTKGLIKLATGDKACSKQAQVELAYLYYNQYKLFNLSKEKGVKLSLSWAHKAASSGYAEGEYALGSIYLYDDPKVHDVKKGIFYLKQAAEKDHISALDTLSLIYLEGYLTNEGIKTNKIIGCQYYNKYKKLGGARRLNHPDCLNNETEVDSK